jgi:predicted nucleic-acid-binding Zn-ribbon protein
MSTLPTTTDGSVTEKIATISHKLKRRLDYGGSEDPFYTKPRIKCAKCGSFLWVPCDISLTWICIHCGNTAYYAFGELIQQISKIMASVKKNEFVYSPNKQCIWSKKNEEVKEVRTNANKKKRKCKK